MHDQVREIVYLKFVIAHVHAQIYHLRTLPQALVTPLSQTIRDKSLQTPDSGLASSLYSKIEKVAVEGARDLDKFKQDWLSDESKALWKRTQTTSYPQGTSIWYTDYNLALKAYKDLHESPVPDENTAKPDTRDPKDIVEGFKQQHSSVPIKSLRADTTLPLEMTVAGMSFQINSLDVDGKERFVIEGSQSAKMTELQMSILKQLDRRRAKDNMAYLLVCYTMFRSLAEDLI